MKLFISNNYSDIHEIKRIKRTIQIPKADHSSSNCKTRVPYLFKLDISDILSQSVKKDSGVKASEFEDKSSCKIDTTRNASASLVNKSIDFK